MAAGPAEANGSDGAALSAKRKWTEHFPPSNEVTERPLESRTVMRRTTAEERGRRGLGA